MNTQKLMPIKYFYFDSVFVSKNDDQYIGLRKRGSLGIATHCAKADYWKEVLELNPDLAALWEVVPIY